MDTQPPVEILGLHKVTVSGELPERTLASFLQSSSAELESLAQALDLGQSEIGQMARRYFSAPLDSIYLVELIVRTRGLTLEISAFGQVDPCFPDSGWQVPHQPTVLSGDGVKVLGELHSFALRSESEPLPPELRLAFFTHYLDPEQPMETPFGRVNLPPVTPVPDRLRVLRYESVTDRK